MKTTNTIKNFAKRVVMVLVAILMVSNAWGATTIDFTFLCSGNETPTSKSVSPITVTFDNSEANNPAKYYTNGTALRMYSGGKITFSSSSGNITKIVFASNSNTAFSSSNADPDDDIGSFTESDTWEGNASSVTFTVSATVRISTATVTTAASGYTVTIAKNNNSYGNVSASSVTGVTSGTSISASSNVLSVGATNVTATANSGYKFNNWTGIPGGGTVTGNVTVTANFAAVSYTNYRTLCSTTDPSVLVSPASLTGLDYIVGSGPSAAKSFSMSGSNLTSGTLTVTAPTNFQVSKASGSGWASSITFTDVSGTLAATTVYVRLATGKSAGEYSGNVSISGCGLASAVNVALSGTVYTPTITADPASVSWNTSIGVAPATRSVTVTGTHLKGNISVALNGTDASSFSIGDVSSIAQATAEGAGGTITITYTGSYAATTTKTANIQLTASDATTVNVPITFNVIVDPNRYELTSFAEIGPKDKVIIVGDNGTKYAMSNNNGTTNPPSAIDVTDYIIEAGAALSIADASTMLWNIVKAGDGSFEIRKQSDNDVWLYFTSSNGNGVRVGTSAENDFTILSDGIADGYIYNAYREALLGIYNSQDWRRYSYTPGTSLAVPSNISGQTFSYYVQKSTDPYVMLSSSFSEFTYEYNNGPSVAQSFTVSGANLSANLVVTAPTNYEVCKTAGGTYTSSVEFTPSTGTVSEQTVYIHLAAGKTVGTYNYAAASGLAVTSTGADAVKAALTGSVTPQSFTVTATSSNVSHGTVSPASQSTTTNMTITASPVDGYRVVSGAGGYTVTAGTASVTNNGDNTFTVTPSTDCTVRINFEAIPTHKVRYWASGTIVQESDVREGAAIPDQTTKTWVQLADYCATRTACVGWCTNPDYSHATTAPTGMITTMSPGGTMSTSDVNYYAVFANTGGASTSFSRVTSLSQLADGDVIAIVAEQSGGQIFSTSADHKGGSAPSETDGKITVSASTNQWKLEASSTSWKLHKGDNNADILCADLTYTAYGNAMSIVDAKTSNYFFIKSSSKALEYYSSSWQFYTISNPATDGQNGNVRLKIYKQDAGYIEYATSCACPGYSMHFGTRGSSPSDWSDKDSYCFVASEDADGNTGVYWYLENFELPAKPHFYVGWEGLWNTTDAKSADADFSDLCFGLVRDNQFSCGYKTLGTYSSGNNQGAIGTLRVRSSYTDNNKYIDFIPGGYVLRLSDNGGSSYTSTELIPASESLTETVWMTDITTVSAALASSGKYFVDLKTSSDHVWAPNMSEVANISSMGYKKDGGSSAGSWGTGLSAGIRGKFRIWADNCSKNWNAHFVPYYHLSYDGNGAGATNLPEASDDKSCEGDNSARTVQVSATVPTRDGYTFIGWKDGGGTSYAANANVVLSSDVVLYAQWAQNYSITYNRVGGTNVCADETCGAGITYTVCGTEPTKSGYIFSGWLSNEATPQTYAAGATFTMPAADVTLTAQWTANWRNLTFNVPTGGGSITGGPSGNHVLDNHTFTFPNITGKSDSKWCWTFLGWTETAPNGSGTWATTPSYIAGGATSGAITSNKTYYAVYSKTGAGASGDVECDAAAITAIGTGGGHAYADAEWTITAADLSSWKARAYVGNKGTYLQIKEDAAIYIKLPTVGGNYTSITLNHNSNSGSRTIAYRTATDGSDVATTTTAAYATSTTISIANGSTTGYIMSKSGTTTYQITSITAHFGPPTVYGHTLDDCGCQVTQFDLTYNANSTTFPGSTISCSNEDDYVFASHDDEYTFCSAPTPPTGYRFLYWAENANGTGNHWEAGETVSCLPSADLTVYAFYERVYTVTFDNQGSLTPVTQASAEASVAVPGATSPCSEEWAFVGWSETAIAPMSMLPSLEVEAGEGTYTPEDDITLYAIYRKTSESSPFVAGMSGAYKISNGGDVYAGACNNSKLPETDAAGAEVFYIKYTSDDGGKYTIQQSNGKYVKYAGSSTSIDISDDVYYWTMTKNGDLWHVLGVGSGRYLQYSSSTGFKAYNTSGPTDIAFIATDGQYYYRTMGCEDDYDITFQTNGTTINWTDGYPEGSYKDIASGSTVSTFPTATFEDWTFLGWRTASYTESTGAPESSGIYSTGGNELTIASDVNLYPVFTKFADNEPFDDVNGGDYYIYYIESGSDDGYGNEKRVYAANYTGGGSASYNSTAVCGSAREFTFTKLSNGNWTIYDKTAAKYLKYSIGGNDIVHVNSASGAEWTITKNGSAYDVEAVGASSYQLLANGTSSSATFKNYATASLGATYHRITIGGCTNRTFTSSPSNVATINIHGEARITSYASKAVKANTVLSVTASNIGTANLTVSSNNSHFTVSPTSIPVTDRMAGPVSIYVTYTPAADASTDGIEDAIITVSDGAGTPTTASTAAGDVQGRHLPADFVIAAKNTSNNKWYALPANMNGTGNPAPVEIAVDDPNDPSVAYTEASNIYNLYTNGTPEYVQLGMKTNVNGNSKSYALWANNSVSSTDIGKNTGLAENSLDGNYRWLLTQTNTSAATAAEWKYTISNPNNANPLKLWLAAGGTGVPYWGLYASGISELRLIPAGTVVPTEAYFVEWGKNGGVVEVDAANAGGDGIAAAKVKAKLNGAESGLVTLSQTLTSVKNRASVYNYTVNFGNDIDFSATASAGAMLTLEWYTSNDVLVAVSNISVPRIIATSGTMSTIESRDTYWTTTNGPTNEVHVLPGVTLTANAGSFSNSDVTIKQLEIYQGATVKVTTGTLDVDTLVLRNGWSRAGEKRYDVARLHIATTANLTTEANHVYADWYIDYDQYYPVAVPWDVTLANIRYRYCSVSPSIGYDQNIRLRYYDGDERAKGSGTESNWKDFGKSGNIAMPAKIVPAHGYAITAKRPSGKAFSILRMPLTIPSNSWTASGEQGVVSNTHKDTVNVIAHRYEKTPWYAMGWNFVANPYMCTFNSAGDEGITGNLSTQNGGSVRYATIPDVDFKNFEQVNIATADLKPSSGFLVQVGTTGALTFNKEKIVAPTAPARYMAEQESIAEQEVYVLLSNDGGRDQMGLIIGSDYTEAYEVNADLSKMLGESNTLKTWMRYTDMDMAYVAINEDLAREWIPVTVNIPANGEYTYSMLNSSIVDELEGVYLIDYKTGKTTNLIYDDYTFSSEAGTDSGRFAINAIVGKHNVPTGADLTESERNSNSPVKFIWQDKVYILHNNVIYDSTGKRVNVINK